MLTNTNIGEQAKLSKNICEFHKLSKKWKTRRNLMVVGQDDNQGGLTYD